MADNVIDCFWLTPTAQGEVSLRRYKSGEDCPGVNGYHNAINPIGRAPMPPLPAAGLVPDTYTEPSDREMYGPVPEPWDDRWPTKCACGYVFRSEDNWQRNTERLYECQEKGLVTTLAKAPAGAMHDSWWFGRFGRGADGIALAVMLPDGASWHVDGPASNGPGWQRSGAVPNITAHPSIQTKGYHGWLKEGKLEQC